MKKGKIILSLILISVLLLSGCQKYNNDKFLNGSDYGPSLEFYFEPNSSMSSKYAGYRCIYDDETNQIVPIGGEDVSTLAKGMTYTFSDNKDKVKEKLKEHEKMFQINGVTRFEDMEIINYWGEEKSYVFVIQDGKEKMFTVDARIEIDFAARKDQKLYFVQMAFWSENEKENDYFVKTIIIDLEKDTVDIKDVFLYNEEVEEKFHVNSKVGIPFSDRYKPLDSKLPYIWVEDDSIVYCTPFYTSKKGDSYTDFSYWLQRIDISTGNVEDMKVVSGEFADDLYKTDKGYCVVSHSSKLSDIGWRRPVEGIYLTHYDNDFNIISREEIDCSNFNDCAEFFAKHSEGKIFILGHNRENNKNKCSVYDINSKKMKNAENTLEGFPSAAQIVEMKNGCRLQFK